MNSRKREYSIGECPSVVASKKIKDNEQNVDINVHILTAGDDDDEHDDFEEDDDDDEENDTFVNWDDDSEEIETVKFDQLGCGGDYNCTRNGAARVLLNNERIGYISYTIIKRNLIGVDLSFHEVCDAESEELENIASLFFKNNGELKTRLLRRLNDRSPSALANYFSFLYITKIELNEPYKKACGEENVTVATTAITKFLRANVWQNEDINVTLVMYMPDGAVEGTMEFSEEMGRLDQRPFLRAGFQCFEEVSGPDTFMVYEMQ